MEIMYGSCCMKDGFDVVARKFVIIGVSLLYLGFYIKLFYLSLQEKVGRRWIKVHVITGAITKNDSKKMLILTV